jgi:hypothetical protein
VGRVYGAVAYQDVDQIVYNIIVSERKYCLTWGRSHVEKDAEDANILVCFPYKVEPE